MKERGGARPCTAPPPVNELPPFTVSLFDEYGSIAGALDILHAVFQVATQIFEFGDHGCECRSKSAQHCHHLAAALAQFMWQTFGIVAGKVSQRRILADTLFHCPRTRLFDSRHKFANGQVEHGFTDALCHCSNAILDAGVCQVIGHVIQLGFGVAIVLHAICQSDWRSCWRFACTGDKLDFLKFCRLRTRCKGEKQNCQTGQCRNT